MTWMYTITSKYSAIIYLEQIAIYDLCFYRWFAGIFNLILACSLLGRSPVLHIDVFVRRGEVVQRSLGVGLDRLVTFSPAGGADLSVLVL